MTDPGKLHRFLLDCACSPGDVVSLAPSRSRHLAVVLRIGAGERVRVFSGAGDEYVARVEEADPAAVRVRILRPYEGASSGYPRLTLAFAPPPGQRADVLVEKASELGATVLQPVVCERLQGYRAGAAARRRERWERKAAEAARQCGRAIVPRLAEPVPLDPFLEGCTSGLRLLATTGESRVLWRVLARRDDAPGAVTMAVGPAGGLTLREREAAVRSGFVPVSLGANVLRVETAAVCLLAGVVFWLDGLQGDAEGEAADV
jgi:16S rRNA (uracil1498-N3)-methyltransferase